MLNRRDVLKLVGVTAVSGFMGHLAFGRGARGDRGTAVAGCGPGAGRQEILAAPARLCLRCACEPFIDARTMEIHHDKHHAAYVANLNKAISEMPRGLVRPRSSSSLPSWTRFPRRSARRSGTTGAGTPIIRCSGRF